MKKLFPRMLIFTCINVTTSCKKEIAANQNQANSISSKSFSNGTTTANPNLVFEETFEGSSYFSLKDVPHRIHSIENCNNSTTSPDNTTTGYGWTLTRVTNKFFSGAKGVKFEIRKNQPHGGWGLMHGTPMLFISLQSDLTRIHFHGIL